jgi:protein involved in temperature-dependent protein secretion
MTDWRPLSDEIYTGVGQRLFLIGAEDKAMLEIRAIDFESPAPVTMSTDG